MAVNGRVTNIQDCQSDSQLSTLELVCLMLEKITFMTTLTITPSRLLARCPLLREIPFFRKNITTALSTFGKRHISALKYVE